MFYTKNDKTPQSTDYQLTMGFENRVHSGAGGIRTLVQTIVR